MISPSTRPSPDGVAAARLACRRAGASRPADLVAVELCAILLINLELSLPLVQAFIVNHTLKSLSHLISLARAMVAMTTLSAQTNAVPNGPDPREIPIPEIKTELGSMPGVKDLPVRNGLPDPLVMNDGTRVTTPEQWKLRR